MCFHQIQATKKPSRPNQPIHQPKEMGYKRKGSNQIGFSTIVVDICLALVARQETNNPSNQNHTTLCFPQRLSIFDLHYNKLANKPTHQTTEGGWKRKGLGSKWKGRGWKKEGSRVQRNVQRVKKKGGGWKKKGGMKKKKGLRITKNLPHIKLHNNDILNI